jgi:hypothetical protein
VAIHLSGPPGGGNREVAGRAAHAPCSTLLRVGFTKPTGLPRSLVRSYRTVSPLPVPNSAVGPSAVCSLWHCPAGRPDWPLTSTLPYGVPTFLDPILSDNNSRPGGRAATTQPTHRRSYGPTPGQLRCTPDHVPGITAETGRHRRVIPPL